jgi:hypothetical protein
MLPHPVLQIKTKLKNLNSMSISKINNGIIKKFFSYYLPAILIVALLATSFYIFQTPKKAEAVWYNSSWSYRKPIIVDRNKVTPPSYSFSSAGNTTFVVPTGVSSITVMAWGGGGGGGGDKSNNSYGGDGGMVSL